MSSFSIFIYSLCQNMDVNDDDNDDTVHMKIINLPWWNKPIQSVDGSQDIQWGCQQWLHTFKNEYDWLWLHYISEI